MMSRASRLWSNEPAFRNEPDSTNDSLHKEERFKALLRGAQLKD